MCVQGDVRLVNGPSNYEGRVEVCDNNAWGTVCDDGWGITDGNVVCRQLGFGGASGVSGTAFYGQGTGSILLDQVDCAGTELALLDCPSNGIGIHDCSHFEDAGVACEGEEMYRNVFDSIIIVYVAMLSLYCLLCTKDSNYYT